MKQIVWIIFVGFISGYFIGKIGAQDAVPTVANVPTIQLSPTSLHTIAPGTYASLVDISMQYNICPELIFAANVNSLLYYNVNGASREEIKGNYIFANLHDMQLVIPTGNPCYTIVDTHMQQQLSQIEQDYNVCIEEFYKLIRRSKDGRDIAFVRNDAPPCVNEQGQRLVYYRTPYTWLAGDYSTIPTITAPEDISALGYCLIDLLDTNKNVIFPHVNYYYPRNPVLPYIAGMKLFVPETARRCDYVPAETYNLYDVSQKYNVCMEAILDISDMDLYSSPSKASESIDDFYLSIPLDVPPCYSDDGQRLNVPEEKLYAPQTGEIFADVARKHNLCMDALWDANPVMNEWDSVSYRLPDVMFIPVKSPCKFTMSLTSRSNMTLMGVATMVNVCRNRIYDDNPHLGLVGTEEGDRGIYLFDEKIPSGKTITFREDRPPCYRMISQEHIDQIHYVCYAVPVTPGTDYSGHIPPINGSAQDDLPYCYETSPNMTVIYNNVSYTVYQQKTNDTYRAMGRCFGIDAEKLQEINQTIPDDTRPYSFYWLVFIPQPHKDCWMLTDDYQTYYQRYLEQGYRAGYLRDGIYAVNYQDTLGSIGRKFGYLPQWIADTNGISLSDPIYYLQELRMPPFPSLYTFLSIGGVAVGVGLIGGTLYGLRRWRRRRFMSKKKNG
jgi:hypothetical protein